MLLKRISENELEKKLTTMKNLDLLIKRYVLPERFILKHKKKWSVEQWLMILQSGKFSESFLNKITMLFMDSKGKQDNKFNSHWFEISKNQEVSENFILKYREHIHWQQVAEHQKLSEYFIKRYLNRLNIWGIIEGQELSISLINFIIKHVKMDKECFPPHCMRMLFARLSVRCSFSEQFIEENENELNWMFVFRTQVLSRDFVINHISKLMNEENFDALINNEKIEKEVLEEVTIVRKLLGAG